MNETLQRENKKLARQLAQLSGAKKPSARKQMRVASTSMPCEEGMPVFFHRITFNGQLDATHVLVYFSQHEDLLSEDANDEIASIAKELQDNFEEINPPQETWMDPPPMEDVVRDCIEHEDEYFCADIANMVGMIDLSMESARADGQRLQMFCSGA